MKREEFCEVLGDINENYVKEAGANPKAEKRRQFKWKVIAACLCLLLAAPLTVFAMDTIQYQSNTQWLGTCLYQKWADHLDKLRSSYLVMKFGRKQPADGRNSEPAAR